MRPAIFCALNTFKYVQYVQILTRICAYTYFSIEYCTPLYQEIYVWIYIITTALLQQLDYYYYYYIIIIIITPCERRRHVSAGALVVWA